MRKRVVTNRYVNCFLFQDKKGNTYDLYAKRNIIFITNGNCKPRQVNFFAPCQVKHHTAISST